jgi:hypothetical protein
MKLRPVTIFLSDQLFAIASNKAGAIGVDRYLEHFVAAHLYDDISKKPKETEEIAENLAPKPAPISFPPDVLPDTVLQIHAIVRHMREDGLSFKKAVKVTAREFNVNESTVRDKCTRRITISTTDVINTYVFNELLKIPEKLVNHLCLKFPDHRQAIIEKFQPFSNRTPVTYVAENGTASNRSYKRRAPKSNFGAQLNEEWKIGARHALFRKTGDWYVLLQKFPGALCDKNGYILFKSESDYRSCPYLKIGKEISVPFGISKIPGYIRKR